MRAGYNNFRRIVNKTNFRRTVTYFSKHGFRGLKDKVLYNLKGEYGTWYKKHRTSIQELDRQRTVKFVYSPKFSILVPTYNTPEKSLRERIESVTMQTYSNVELCIADASTDENVGKIIKSYSDSDDRVKYLKLEENDGISGNTNKAFTIATGDYIGLLDHDDALELDALYEVVKSLQEIHYDVIYTDEDKCDSEMTTFMDPNFKPDYSPDLLLSGNYITHFFVTKKEIVDKVGGFRSEYDGAQDFDFIFRCIENAENVKHIAKILYHWRMHNNSTAGNPNSKSYAYLAGRKAVDDHIKRIGGVATVENTDMLGIYHPIFDVSDNPLVSIIIVNKNNSKNLEKCIDSLFNVNSYSNIEILIADNNSDDRETKKLYKSLDEKYENVKVLRSKEDRKQQELNNKTAKKASGEYLLFLDSNICINSENAIADMLGHCKRSEVGVVGGKILNTDRTVHSAGFVLTDINKSKNIYMEIKGSDYGYMLRTKTNGNYKAVSGKCMMTMRETFLDAKGFDDSFESPLQYIDYCLKLGKDNLLTVFDGFAQWTIMENKGDKVQKNSSEESKLFKEKWNEVLSEDDSCYNNNFSVKNIPFQLK